jgi:hypothetical protein
VFQASEEDMESRGGGTSNTFEFIPPKQISELAEQFSVRDHGLFSSISYTLCDIDSVVCVVSLSH